MSSHNRPQQTRGRRKRTGNGKIALEGQVPAAFFSQYAKKPPVLLHTLSRDVCHAHCRRAYCPVHHRPSPLNSYWGLIPRHGRIFPYRKMTVVEEGRSRCRANDVFRLPTERGRRSKTTQLCTAKLSNTFHSETVPLAVSSAATALSVIDHEIGVRAIKLEMRALGDELSSVWLQARGCYLCMSLPLAWSTV